MRKTHDNPKPDPPQHDLLAGNVLLSAWDML
jgi:hypothetical protein